MNECFLVFTSFDLDTEGLHEINDYNGGFDVSSMQENGWNGVGIALLLMFFNL